MRISILVFLVLMSFCAVSAQKKAKPDFTGTWVLDEEKSKGPFDSKIDKFSTLYPDLKKTDIIIIEHAEPRLTVTEKRVIEKFDNAKKLIDKNESVLSSATFYTDKRGESNLFGAEGVGKQSTTTWNGKDIFVSLKMDDKKKDLSMLIFSLSNDGKELTIKNAAYVVRPTAAPGPDYSLSPAAGGKKVYRKVE